jgi:hypothetical protein
MSDIDRVFARLGGGQPAQAAGRERRNIPRRGGATGARVVEVVRLPSRAAGAGGGGPRRADLRVRAETWDDGFPAKSVSPVSALQPAAPEPAEPVTHVMPIWEPTLLEAEKVAAPAPLEAARTGVGPRAQRARRLRTGSPRSVADPFDETDDRANCLRCGYAIQPARERRGLMTCAGCG